MTPALAEPDVELEVIAQRGRMDFFFFAKYILGYPDIEEEPHKTEMVKWIEDTLKRPRDLQNGLMKCPRGTFKSTICTIAFSCWILIQDGSNPLIPIYGPDMRILIDSETYTKAAAYLDAIKDHLRDSYFQELYGDMITGALKDKEGELLVTTRKKTLKESTIMCTGVGKAMTGFHFDVILFDDLVSINNIQTAEQLQKVYQHFTLSFALLDPGGWVFVNGTSWHQDDTYIRIENDLKSVFHIKIYDSVNKDLENILVEEPTFYFFKERLTWAFLKRQRIVLGPTDFSAQYRNQPLPSEEQIFKPEYIKFFGELEREDRNGDMVPNLPNPSYLFQATDPSMGENPGNDSTGMVVIAVDSKNNWYVFEAIQERMEPHSMCQQVLDHCRDYEPLAVVFERLGLGKGLGVTMDDMADAQGVSVPFEDDPVSSNTAKTIRIQSLEPMVAAGRLHFPGKGPEDLFGGFKKLYDLMLEFRTDRRPKKCDVLDALSMLINVAAAPAKFESKKREKGNFDHFHIGDEDEKYRDPDYDDDVSDITGV